MNDAIFKFKRYEDASLSYTGVDKHAGEDVGGWDTVIRKEEYQKLFYNQQETMAIPNSDLPAEPATPKKTEPQSTPVKEEEAKDSQVDAEASPKSEPVLPHGPTVIPHTAPTIIPPRATQVQPAQAADAAKDREEKIRHLNEVIQVGSTVRNKKFGEGKIISINQAKTRLVIRFAEGEKTYIFPDAFLNKFLEEV